MPASQPPARNPETTVPPAPAAASPGSDPRPQTLPPEHMRIRNAIFRVVEHPTTQTSVKGLLGEYVGFIGARLRYPDFPVTLREHSLNRDNAADQPITFIAAFIHHVGSTIKAYQELHHMQNGVVNLKPAFKEAVTAAKAKLDRRLAQLELLSRSWPAVKYHPECSPIRGYSLVTPDQHAEITQKLAEKEKLAVH